jgi:dipeptidase E
LPRSPAGRPLWSRRRSSSCCWACREHEAASPTTYGAHSGPLVHSLLVRLYLSSFRLGDHPHRLLELAGHGRNLALVASALDASLEQIRRAGVDREIGELTPLGFIVTEIDLRNGFEAAKRLSEADVIWVRGGNVFVLRRALADTGADAILVDLLERDAVVYAGYSAGVCVLAPDLRGLERVDDVMAVRNPIYNGLGILDRPVVPHVDSPGHPETRDCDALSADLTRAGRCHWALSDGEVLLASNSPVERLQRNESPASR